MQQRAKNASPRAAVAEYTRPADSATAQNLARTKTSADPRDAYEQTDQLARRLEG